MNTFFSLLDAFDDFFKKLNDYESSEDNIIATFKYNNIDSFKEEKDIIIEKLNILAAYARIMNIKDGSTVKFVFDENVFYFVWESGYDAFVTTDPNGDEFVYDDHNEVLYRLNETTEEETAEKAAEKATEEATEKQYSGVEEYEKDNSVTNPNVDAEPDHSDSDINDDKNLAFNLRNKLRDEYAKSRDKKIIFCPGILVELFKPSIIDNSNFTTEYDEDGNPVNISFLISDVINLTESDSDTLDEIYHNETDHLDKYCELIKEKYNFSLGWWNTILDETCDERKVSSIVFTFVF